MMASQKKYSLLIHRLSENFPPTLSRKKNLNEKMIVLKQIIISILTEPPPQKKGEEIISSHKKVCPG